MTTNPIDQFREALSGRGIIAPLEIVGDGVLHRCDAEGKGGKKDAAYLLHLDGVPAGGFENHRDGLGWEAWRADVGRTMASAEQAEHRTRIDAARKQRDSDQAMQHAEARERAGLILADAYPATDHPYQIKKGIQPHGTKVIDADKARSIAPNLSPDLAGLMLVIPMRADGVLHSLQFITADGLKRPLTGGRVTGCYCSIGSMKDAATLAICEGYATGATIHEATGYPVAVAFSAGNLMAVSQAMCAKFPNLLLILCADDDHLTSGNPGLTRANDAARVVGGVVAVPDFGSNRPEKSTDFNDLAQLHGLEAVERCIASAAAPVMPVPQADEPSAPKATQAGETNTDAVDSIKRLAALSPVEYDRTRKAEADALGIRPATLDKLVGQARKDEESTGLDFDDVDPWPHPVNPAELLSEVSATVRRFIICQPETADAVALWAAMTWFMDVVQIAPLAVITAPEKRCGKSLLLFLLGRLSYRPLTASNITPAALFRSIDAWKPTLLVDESDAFMRENEELRGLLNCGHTRESAYIIRTVGEDFTPTRFNVWGAKALAGIGHLADTLMDRAVTLELRRKLPHEVVERLRYAEPGLFDDLTAKLARFAEDHRDAVRRARPALPASLNDRAQDNWEPLLAIADVAGGTWPDLARKAALKLSGVDSPTMSTGTELLADIQEVFEHKRVSKISTADLIEALCDDDEKVWATFNRGRPVSPRQIAKRLAGFDIKSKNIRIGYDVAKGFDLEQFQEAFARYLSTPPELPLHPLQTPEASNHAGFRVADEKLRSSNKNASATPEPAPVLGCSGVAGENGVSADCNDVEVEI